MSMAPRIQTKLKKRDAAVVAENTAVNDGANEIPASAEDADGKLVLLIPLVKTIAKLVQLSMKP